MTSLSARPQPSATDAAATALARAVWRHSCRVADRGIPGETGELVLVAPPGLTWPLLQHGRGGLTAADGQELADLFDAVGVRTPTGRCLARVDGLNAAAVAMLEAAGWARVPARRIVVPVVADGSVDAPPPAVAARAGKARHWWWWPSAGYAVVVLGPLSAPAKARRPARPVVLLLAAV